MGDNEHRVPDNMNTFELSKSSFSEEMVELKRLNKELCDTIDKYVGQIHALEADNKSLVNKVQFVQYELAKVKEGSTNNVHRLQDVLKEKEATINKVEKEKINLEIYAKKSLATFKDKYMAVLQTLRQEKEELQQKLRAQFEKSERNQGTWQREGRLISSAMFELGGRIMDQKIESRVTMTQQPTLGFSKNAAATRHSALMEECDTVLSQFSRIALLRDAIQRRAELQRELSALKAAGTDFSAIAAAGKALKAATAAVAQQPLSEEAYLTLADRHAALVQRVTVRCRELAGAEEYDPLAALAPKLKTLKAFDVSALPQSGSNAPVLPPPTAGGQDAPWAHDQVLPPLAPTATTATATTATNAAEGVQAEMEEEWANDPVYVPSA